MFHDHHPSIEFSTEDYLPEHYLIDYSGGINITAFFILMGFILTFFRMYNLALQKLGLLVRIFKVVMTEDNKPVCDNQWKVIIDIDEKLGTYWQSLKG